MNSHSLADVGVGDPRGSLAVGQLVDWACIWCLFEDPDTVAFFVDGVGHLWVFAHVLKHVRVASTALAFGFLILSCTGIIWVRANSNGDVVSTPVRVDLVVPAVRIGLPVLGVSFWSIVDVVNTEIVLSALEARELVDAAALGGGSLRVHLVLDATDVAHGARLLVISQIDIVVDQHVFTRVWALLSVATAA